LHPHLFLFEPLSFSPWADRRGDFSLSVFAQHRVAVRSAAHFLRIEDLPRDAGRVGAASSAVPDVFSSPGNRTLLTFPNSPIRETEYPDINQQIYSETC